MGAIRLHLLLTAVLVSGLACDAAAQTSAAPASASTAAPAAKSGDHVFKLVNSAKSAISAIYVSPAGTNNSSDDLLGKQVAGVGKTVTLKVKDPDAACLFDIDFLMNNGDTVTRKAVDLCQTDAYTFTP